MASFADTAPILLTEPPAAPEPSAPVIEARQEAPASAESGESGSTALDFFLSMAKPEPALSATATSRNSASTAVRPSRPAVAPAPSAAPSVDASSSIIARRVPVLPFTLSPWQPGLVIEVTEEAPAWLTRNARIVSVDGQAVATNAEIAERFQAAEVKDSETFARVNVGIDTGLGTAVTEQTMTVPTEKHTLLLNGLRFVTRDSGAGWTTEVTEVPDGSNFKVGDMLVAYGSQMEMLNGQNSLQNVLERELENGTSSFSFAVRRDGEIWLETFTLASLAN